ncbi:MAG TPA: hypothetical protein VGL86_13805 [Polyangia bacterium]|jgi:hypothetical protein
MRTLIVAVALVIGSCSSGPPRPGGSGYDDMGCKLSCDKCPPKALCVGAPYVPQCLQACVTDADCDAGTCAVILDPAGVRVCVAANMLMACEPVTCTNDVAQCLDANTALTPLPENFHTCGWQPMRCDSGCDSATGKCN